MSTDSHIDSLRGPVAPPATLEASAQAKTPEQLRVLAAQFESMLLSQMLTQMRSTLFDDDDEGGGFGKGPLADAMFSELSLALSRAGGFGLTDSLMDPLLRQTAGGSEELAGISMPTAQTVMAALPSPINPGGASATAMPEFGATPPSVDAALIRGRISSGFGWREHPVTGGTRFHKGVDIAMPTGRDVPVARGGQVEFAGRQGGYGLTVVVDHGNGLSTRYAHLSELHVAAGDAVTEGQTIAQSGATGRVTGAHLHFEVTQHGRPVDPAVALGRSYASR
jgi:murein DD-endopeptidase MepM/ murein hydrolase activator NlpD